MNPSEVLVINLTFGFFAVKSSGSSFPSYIGCLNLTASELQANWIFPGTAPSCSYVHHNGSSSGGSGSSSGSSGSSGGSSSSGGSGSNSGSSGSNDGSSSSGSNGGSSSSGSNGGSSSSGNSGGSSSGDGSGSSSGNDSDNSSSSNNGDGSSSSGNSGSGNNNSGGDSSSSGNNGSTDSNSNNNGGDSSSSENKGSTDSSSNNNGDDGNGDDGRNSGNQDGNSYNSGGNGGYDGSSSNSDEVVTNGYGYNGQSNGNNDQESGYSGGSSYSPYSDFDVGTCDTYENLWLWDFSLTCDDADNLESCECNFAEEMLGIGLLSCDMAAECPKDCAICTTCFQVIGCITGGKGGLNSAKSAANFLYVIAAGAGVLFFGIVYYSANRKRGNQALEAYLMEDQGESASGSAAPSPPAPPVWLAPDDASSAEIPSSNLPSSPVWLAPDAPPVQFVPSSQAAMESSGESSHDTTAHGAFIIPGIFPVSSEESSESEDNNVWLAPIS